MAILHPYLGAALALLFLAYAIGIWRDNLLNGSDREWLLRLPAIMMKKAESPVEGKYNAGQKVMFWSMAACILALLASGVAIWRPTLAPAFSAPARRAANIVHAFVAFVMFVGIGVHAYAAFWTRGSIRSMTRGYVTRAWARFHHPGWYHAVTGDGERPAARRGGAP
jgi:formate dehydrogenase subunit gamma